MNSRSPERTGAVDGTFVLAAALAFSLVTGSLCGLVWVRAEVTREGYRAHALQAELVEARQRGADLRVERAALLRPSRLATLARALGLDAPTASQIVPMERP